MFLEHEMKKRYPDTRFSFYLSKRKKSVHIGLEMPLMNYTKCLKIVSNIEECPLARKENQ